MRSSSIAAKSAPRLRSPWLSKESMGGMRLGKALRMQRVEPVIRLLRL